MFAKTSEKSIFHLKNCSFLKSCIFEMNASSVAGQKKPLSHVLKHRNLMVSFVLRQVLLSGAELRSSAQAAGDGIAGVAWA